jgi:hypothetical protein
VRVTVLARAAAIERPSEAQVRAVVDEFVAALRRRDVDALEQRLAATAGDGSAARELRGVGAQGARPPRRGAGRRRRAARGATARVAVRVPLQWKSGGMLGSGRSKDVVFYVGLRHGDGAWQPGEVVLAARFAP